MAGNARIDNIGSIRAHRALGYREVERIVCFHKSLKNNENQEKKTGPDNGDGALFPHQRGGFRKLRARSVAHLRRKNIGGSIRMEVIFEQLHQLAGAVADPAGADPIVINLHHRDDAFGG